MQRISVMEEDLFSSEIADLESFIDSYVGEPEPVASEVFTNTNIGSSGNNHSGEHRQISSLQDDNQYNDFQTELLEHQKRQEKILLENPEDLSQFINWNINQSDMGPNSHNGYQDVQAMHSMKSAHQQYSHMPPPHYSEPNQQTNGFPAPFFPPYYSNPEWVNTANLPFYNPYDPNTNFPNIAPQSPSDINHTHQNILDTGANDKKSTRNVKYTSPNNRSSENGNFFVNKATQRKHFNKNPNKMPNRRKSSETSQSEESLNWRKPVELSSEEVAKQNMGLRRSKETNGHKERSSKDISKTSPPKQETRRKNTPPKAKHDQPQHSRQSSQSSSADSTTGSGTGSKVVSGRAKAAVNSWLKNDKDPQNSNIEKQMKKLEVSQKKDLPRLIKTAQSYITSDKKVREVAEMVCNKAMRNPLFAENGAILCNEMSHRLTNGTNFRTVVLNIVQGHFKNRHHLLVTSIKNPGDTIWIGFCTFLCELLVNLRTASNERIKALYNPVFDCFFQMLKHDSLPPYIAKCFTCNLLKVGSILEKSNKEKMAEFISLLRDKCILRNDFSVDTKRCLLQSLESHARGWKNNALDDLFYDQFKGEFHAN